MVEEKKVDLAEYWPIRRGAVKAWPIMLLFVAWVTSFMTLMLTNWGVLRPVNKDDPWEVSVIAYFALASASFATLAVAGLGKRVWEFLVGYWNRNARGYFAYFSYRLDGVLDAWVSHHQLWDGAGSENQLVWKVPLGGWFRGKPVLLVSAPYYPNRMKWRAARWNILFSGLLWDIKDYEKMTVQLSDGWGNVCTTVLPKALTYASANYDSDLRGMFRRAEELEVRCAEQAQLIDGIGSVAESFLYDLQHDFKRFANSTSGKTFLEEQEGRLKDVWPDYRERVSGS